MSQKTHSLRKAAILVASLDDEMADKLLEQMPEEQAALVRRMIVDLGDVDPREQDNVLNEFFRIGPAAPEPTPPVEPARIPMVVDELQLGTSTALVADEETPFRFLHEAKGEKLTPILASEHPQTIALVVSHLPPDKAADVLATLASNTQVEVIRRLVVLDEANPEILREVERGLQTRIVEHVRDERRKVAGMQAVATILSAADPRIRREILSNVAIHDRQLAGRLMPQQVEFADLDSLDDTALALILDTADAEVVMLALAGAAPALVERILSQLPARDARLLRRALDTLGPTRLSDVEAAQRELGQLAQRLGAEGRIDLPVDERLVAA